MGIEVTGFFGLLLLIADIWAIIKTFQSGSSALVKAIWVVVILLMPLLGLLLWLIFGPRPSAGRY